VLLAIENNLSGDVSVTEITRSVQSTAADFSHVLKERLPDLNLHFVLASWLAEYFHPQNLQKL